MYEQQQQQQHQRQLGQGNTQQTMFVVSLLLLASKLMIQTHSLSSLELSELTFIWQATLEEAPFSLLPGSCDKISRAGLKKELSLANSFATNRILQLAASFFSRMLATVREVGGSTSSQISHQESKKACSSHCNESSFTPTKHRTNEAHSNIQRQDDAA